MTTEGQSIWVRRVVLSLVIIGGTGLLGGLLLALISPTQSAAAPNAPQASFVVSQKGTASAFAGEVLTYTIALTNTSGETVNGIELFDTWTTNAPQADPNKDKWWDRGILANFNGYVATPANAIEAFTQTIELLDRRGEATWSLYPLAAGESVEIVFSVTAPITLQPALKAHEPWDDIGPSNIANSVVASAPGEENVEAPVVSAMVIGPLLSIDKMAEGEVAPEDHCRVGRLVTYTVRIQNVTEEDGEERPDVFRASNLVVQETLPEQIQDRVIEVTADQTGVITAYDPALGVLSWTLPNDLAPGATTTVTFIARVPPDTDYNPRKQYLENDKESLLAWADGMPMRPANANDRLRTRILSPFDKIVTTGPPLDQPATTYANRPVTYTLTFYNPLHDHDIVLADALRLVDGLHNTFMFSEMLLGSTPDVIEGSYLRWDNMEVAANGAITMSYRVDVPSQALPSAGWTGCVNSYPNSVTATAVIPGFGTYIGHDDNEMAVLDVEKEIDLTKRVEPSLQLPGEVVTYTITLENVGERYIPDPIVLTDVLPMDEMFGRYFSFQEMVAPTAAPFLPTQVLSDGAVVVWDNLPGLDVGASHILIFQAVVDGVAHVKYYNDVLAYNAETGICPIIDDNKTRVEVDTPFRINKTALQSEVVQGELLSYEAHILNISPRTLYTVTAFRDDLSSVLFSDPADDDYEYNYTVSPPASLPPGETWDHTFEVRTTGLPEDTGLGSDWCEDRGKGKDLMQDMATVLFDVREPEMWRTNADKLRDSSVVVIPHVSILQSATPNPVAVGELVTLTITLQDNRTAPTTDITGMTLEWELPNANPGDFTLVASSLPTSSQDSDLYYWSDLTLPAGGTTELVLTLRAPLLASDDDRKQSYKSKTRVTEIDDPAICVPSAEKVDGKTLDVVPGVLINKEPDVERIGPYGEVEYLMEVENTTGATVRDVVVIDILPDNWLYLDWVSGPEPYSEDPLQWIWDELPPETVVEIVFRARAYTDLGTWRNGVECTAPIHWMVDKKYTETVGVFVAPGVGFFKDVSPEEVKAGEVVTYTINLFNGTNDKILSNILLTETLPGGFTFLETVEGPPEIAVQGQQVKWLVADPLEKNDRLQIVFRARTGEELVSGDYYNPHVSVYAEDQDTGELVDISDIANAAPVYVAGIPTVMVRKTAHPSRITAGERVTYTLSLFNEMDTAQTIALTDTLPHYFTYDAHVAGATPNVLSGHPTRLVWPSLHIEPQETITMAFRVHSERMTPSGKHYNRLETLVGGFYFDHPNLAPVSVTGLPRVDAQVTKDDGETWITPGQEVIYTVRYTNDTDDGITLRDVVLTDTIAPASAVEVDAAGWTPIGGGRYTYAVGTLDPMESGELSVSAALTTAIPDDEVFVLSNTVEIGYRTDEDVVESNPQNNRATDSDPVHGPDLVITQMAVTPTHLLEDDPPRVYVTVANQGDLDADQLWTGQTDTDLFEVRVYLKSFASTAMPTPPSSVFDHEEEYCNVLAPPVAAGESVVVSCESASAPVEGEYAIYAQVDTSEYGQPPWGKPFGLIREAIEDNNVTTTPILIEGQTERMIYLPVIVRQS
jgi:uncharacterized repeat protein (TIGR01451 family)